MQTNGCQQFTTCVLNGRLQKVQCQAVGKVVTEYLKYLGRMHKMHHDEEFSGRLE